MSNAKTKLMQALDDIPVDERIDMLSDLVLLDDLTLVRIIDQAHKDSARAIERAANAEALLLYRARLRATDTRN